MKHTQPIKVNDLESMSRDELAVGFPEVSAIVQEKHTAPVYLRI